MLGLQVDAGAGGFVWGGGTTLQEGLGQDMGTKSLLGSPPGAFWWVCRCLVWRTHSCPPSKAKASASPVLSLPGMGLANPPSWSSRSRAPRLTDEGDGRQGVLRGC